jgi:hypothetical protein
VWKLKIMSGVLKKLLGGGAVSVIKEVSDVADKFIQTPEEKKEFEAAIERTISERWKADMESDSWLSKNVRPLTLIVVISTLILLTFFDGANWLDVDDAWISLWQMVSVSVIGGYFAVRTIDKRGKVK